MCRSSHIAIKPYYQPWVKKSNSQALGGYKLFTNQSFRDKLDVIRKVFWARTESRNSQLCTNCKISKCPLKSMMWNLKKTDFKTQPAAKPPKRVLIVTPWTPSPCLWRSNGLFCFFESLLEKWQTAVRWRAAQGPRRVSGSQTTLRSGPGSPAGRDSCRTAWLTAGAAAELSPCGCQCLGWPSWTWCCPMRGSHGSHWTVTPGTFWWI